MLMMSPRQRRQKFLLMPARITSVFPQRGRDDAAQRRQVFPSMNQQENQATLRKQHLRTNNKYSQPDVLKGLSIPFTAPEIGTWTGESCNRLIDRTANKINCSKVFLYFWFNRSENKSKGKQIAKANILKKRSGGRRFHQWLLSRKIANGG